MKMDTYYFNPLLVRENLESFLLESTGYREAA